MCKYTTVIIPQHHLTHLAIFSLNEGQMAGTAEFGKPVR